MSVAIKTAVKIAGQDHCRNLRAIRTAGPNMNIVMIIASTRRVVGMMMAGNLEGQSSRLQSWPTGRVAWTVKRILHFFLLLSR
jgi:hypothetical protein